MPPKKTAPKSEPKRKSAPAVKSKTFELPRRPVANQMLTGRRERIFSNLKLLHQSSNAKVTALNSRINRASELGREPQRKKLQQEKDLIAKAYMQRYNNAMAWDDMYWNGPPPPPPPPPPPAGGAGGGIAV